MAQTTKYVHHYFDESARGDPIRLTFHVAGVDFEDKYYTMACLPKVKANGKDKADSYFRFTTVQIYSKTANYLLSGKIIKYNKRTFE